MDFLFYRFVKKEVMLTLGLELCTYSSCTSCLTYMRCNPRPQFGPDAISGNENSSLTPCALRSNLSNCSRFSAFFASAAIPHGTCPFDTESKGKKPKSGHPKLGNNGVEIQQKQGVWILQHNGMLKHRLYKPLDAHAQTYGPHNTNKKYKYMDIVSKWANAHSMSFSASKQTGICYSLY